MYTKQKARKFLIMKSMIAYNKNAINYEKAKNGGWRRENKTKKRKKKWRKNKTNKIPKLEDPIVIADRTKKKESYSKEI